eukprot:5112527-Pyramimonas_sp.AAC.2
MAVHANTKIPWTKHGTHMPKTRSTLLRDLLLIDYYLAVLLLHRAGRYQKLSRSWFDCGVTMCVPAARLPLFDVVSDALSASCVGAISSLVRSAECNASVEPL